ncbi:amino acid adenylation domain-containing protein [Chroococcidiopsis sp.]|uniref:amino acid adenylation domain-containing protein n=1 Tax=Chroococcidiopsis sp. TaxID=3088168 RepID=UPI003F31C7C9
MKVTTIETAYPLSAMQQGMLFHSLHAQQSGVDIEQVICSIRDRLNVSAFIQAWQRVVERHPVLRTSFDWKSDRQPLQCVHLQPAIEIEQEDWRSLSALEQKQQLQVYLQRDRASGFQMDRLPLMRLALLQLGDCDYRLIWTFHHAILDGRSLHIVLTEVFAFYDAFCLGEDLEIPQPRPYQDYIQWLQQDWSETANFWQHLLKGFTAPTPLIANSTLAKTLNTDLTIVDRSFGDRELRLSEQTTAILKSLAQQHQLTLNTLVQGAWAILLSRYSRETDIVFGATRACRHSSVAGAESMVGLLINTLPVRVDVSPQQQLLPWLQELRSQWVTLRDYEHTPLVNIQGWSDVPCGTPLFNSLLVFENYELNSALRAQGSRWQNLEFRLEEQTNYPLTLVSCAASELLLKLKYDRQRFDDATIERMLGHLQTLLSSMATNPEQCIGEIPLLTAAERDRIVREWNDTETDFSQELCIHQLFEAQVELTPEAVAVVFEDRQLTYRELNWRANQLARHLQQLGVKPGVLVAVYLERSLETVVAVMGIVKAGGAYVPLEPSFPKARIQLLLSSLAINCLVTQTSLLPNLDEIQSQLPALQHLICLDAGDSQAIPPRPPSKGGLAEFSPPSKGGLGGSEKPFDRQIWLRADLDRLPTDNLPLSASSDDVAYVIFTSGSTGTPKGVVVRHQPVINLIQWVNKTFAINSSDRVLFVTSLCFDLSVYDIFGLLAAGGSIRVVSNRDVQDPEALWRILRDEPITFWDSAPPALQQLATFFPKIEWGDRHPQLRLVFMSGDWIPVKLPDALKAAFPGVKVISLGGATEATVWSNYYPIQTVEPHWVSIPYGKPIQNARYYILDSDLNPCPIGVAGELHIGGKCLASGYLNQPDLTAQKFIPDPFNDNPTARLYKTGDLARYLSDGNIEFLGRIDHQVKIRGFRIELGEIETVLAQHPQVRETVILVREDEPGHKRLVAYVVGHQSAPGTSELRRFLQERLPEYMVPAAFVAIAEIPLTPNGKVDRRALPIPDRDRPDLEKAFAAPSNAVELQLTQIWSEILGIQSIGVSDNFFELGGHSLLAVQLFTQIESKFGKKLPLATLFQAPTIEQLANIVGGSEQLVSWSSLVAIQPHGDRYPLFCIHALGGNVLGYQKLVRHLGAEQPVYGLQARGLDGKQNPHTKVEDMAADYIQEMRTVQPNGPYLLCGFSSGGTVAFEMARQLQAQGEEVALLAMFDTYSPRLFIHNPSLFRTIYSYLRTLWQLPLPEKQTYFLQKLDWIHSLLTGKQSSKYDLWNNYALSENANPYDMVLIEALKQATMVDYVPQSYSGRVALFTSKEVLRWCYSTPDRGWNSFVEPGVEIHEIPGTHLGLLDEPNVQVLASKLKNCLEQAQVGDRSLSLVDNSRVMELSIG